MLPLTSHKSFQIPHSLATVAAIAALISALGWEASGNDSEQIEASSHVATQIGFAGAKERHAQEDRATDDPAAPAERENCPQGCGRNSLSELLPLVLPSLSGH
ncbi:MAG: hypothetical protein KGY48_04085 [Wenzhouxiangellaceae bacterium]|jgi:hypothetical protein|nr:hypothetical protein [Wenzhouxiangellaceae bacterium]MBS3747139.1 hypothetical protein [Wenzhouxiangellaceae bacterium]MBS3823678.1 hypothetical protein [Wenzhouxiangellaceae bacterium]